MKRAYWRHRHNSQRGSVGADTPSLTDSLRQLEGVEVRVQRLKTGVSNLLQLQETQTHLPPEDGSDIAQDILELQAAVDAFELDLASRVISWQHLQEPFWQALRFGGLGLLIGWALAWWVSSS